MSLVERQEAAYAQADRQRKLSALVIFLLFVGAMAGGWHVVEGRNAGGFWGGVRQLGDFPADVLSEAWEERANLPGLMVRYFPALLETLNIAAVSTIFGGIGALVLALLSTRGIAPWPRFVPVFRRTMDIMRAIPDIVIALVLIFVLGGGPVPAMIAIAFHTVGALGKLFSEVSENADLKPVDGVRATGAGWVQQMWFGVVNQVSPNFTSYFLLRFEVNVRASAILGFVGAGGIGYDLRNTITWGQGEYDAATAIFMLLFLTIVAVDQLSGWVRHHLTSGDVRPTEAAGL